MVQKAFIEGMTFVSNKKSTLDLLCVRVTQLGGAADIVYHVSDEDIIPHLSRYGEIYKAIEPCTRVYLWDHNLVQRLRKAWVIKEGKTDPLKQRTLACEIWNPKHHTNLSAELTKLFGGYKTMADWGETFEVEIPVLHAPPSMEFLGKAAFEYGPLGIDAPKPICYPTMVEIQEALTKRTEGMKNLTHLYEGMLASCPGCL